MPDLTLRWPTVPCRVRKFRDSPFGFPNGEWRMLAMSLSLTPLLSAIARLMPASSPDIATNLSRIRCEQSCIASPFSGFVPDWPSPIAALSLAVVIRMPSRQLNPPNSFPDQMEHISINGDLLRLIHHRSHSPTLPLITRNWLIYFSITFL